MTAMPVPTPTSETPDAALGSRPVSIATPDSFPLGGTLYPGCGDGPLVLVSSATAVPQGLYAAFAKALAAAGARAVLTYDYRGTGASPRPPRWNGRVDYKDWALKDFPAAAAALDAVAPGHPMVGLGQSFGGQALGLSGHGGRFERYAMVATMSGALHLLDDPWVWQRMNLVGVPVSLLHRDMPRWLRLGEPIPASCFRDWARWCRMRNYFFDDPHLPETSRFAELRLPILAIGMTDDPWATPRAVDHFMARHTNAEVEQRWVSPADAGGRPIGHLGFFRTRNADTLWPGLVDWVLHGRPMTIGQRR
jgi:predicted alpha/beta hydrolase